MRFTMKKITTLLSHTLLFISMLCLPFASHAALAPITGSGEVVTNLPAMLQKITPAIVNIAVQGEVPETTNPFPEPGEQPSATPPKKFEYFGSGVIVDTTNGYILTNAHVIRQAQMITVTLSDGRVFKAKLIGADTPSDLAVLQIKADKLTTLVLGNSDALKVGDFVAAIGNPFGLSQTVTSGIISGLQRSNLGIEGYENFIQTDASINPGNSGGALINLKGDLIGINTAIVSPAGGNIGIGFAIPVNMARSVMTQLIKYGAVYRGVIGVIAQDFTPALASAFRVPDQTGALVAQVSPNSPAALAGVKNGDIIQALNNQPITNASQIRNTVGMMRVGTRIDIKILRDGKPITISLVTADPKKYILSTQASNPFLFGLTLRSFNELLAGIGQVSGVQVVSVAQNTMAWHAGVRVADVILSANMKPVSSPEDLQKIAHDSTDSLILNVLHRDNGSEFVVIKKPEGE